MIINRTLNSKPNLDVFSQLQLENSFCIICHHLYSYVITAPLAITLTYNLNHSRNIDWVISTDLFCRAVQSEYRIFHYIDVIMTTMASQITSLTVVYSIVYSGADQRKHQRSASLAFVRGINRDRWIPHTKGQLRGKCFHLMTSSCQRHAHYSCCGVGFINMA